ncbi:exopolysaccharide biosynthesis protein [Parvularcula sp. LCG005]|uniref:exopolysaccharide biosynthesis protein n=1 Tax=Parvularcula sp. LCG005 TaxID=3078805 RepID=UPI002942B92B|nr:exopolysaccharide biosynthesis protein [Parvularcula sp. LCG005]WOI54443.1 exopolysaccharide biosynthesis protein [Parvularcula sp. LCG005]
MPPMTLKVNGVTDAGRDEFASISMTDHAGSDHQHNRLAHVLYTTLDGLSTVSDRPSEAAEDDNPKAFKGPKSTLGKLIDALDERAFGLMLLILALPCCIPFLWGIPQIVALPMLALAAQMAMGREAPWLPKSLQERTFAIEGMRHTVSKAERYLGWLERLAARRLTVLTDGVGVRIVGALMLIPTASILVPAPGTNTAPGIGVAIAAVGLLERDGLLVLLGLMIGLAWVFLLLFLLITYGPEGYLLFKDMVKSLISGGA